MAVFRPKVSIIGGGNVGIRYAYALMIKNETRELVIVDIDKKRIEGEVMDLSHGAPYISPVKLAVGDYSDIENSDLVVITAGKKQKPGQTRLDVAGANVDLFKKIIPEIMNYTPSAIFLIVSNPVDILSYATYKISKKPAHEVIGAGTVLDTARFRYLLAKHCEIDPRNVHAYILGEHGDSEFAVWSKATVGGVFIKDYCMICDKRGICKHDDEFDRIFTEVRDSAYKIIERKQETSYGIGLALVKITQSIVNDENAVLPVSCYVENYHGINDVYLSLPCIVNKKGINKILDLELDETEEQQLKNSANVLKDIINNIDL